MMSIIQTRLMHWKKHWISHLFWFLLPILATVCMIQVTNVVQEDSKIPIGMVVKEETGLANALVETMKASPLLRVYELSESEARSRIESHELDSAFIIEDGYEAKILRGSRNRLLTSYQSNLSFAYTPIREMLISYVQQDTGKAKAAHTIINLQESLQPEATVSFDEIIAKTNEIQAQENLLATTFSFYNDAGVETTDGITIWNTWGLWAIFSILSTLLLSDWLMKERSSGLMPRFTFIRFTYKQYVIQNLAVYLTAFLLFDFLSIAVFNQLLDENINFELIGAIISFRILISTGAFLVALLFKNNYLYYGVSFILVLFLIILSGAILPIDGLTARYPWLLDINPLQPLMDQTFWNPWLVVTTALVSSGSQKERN
ncbi:ABC transporter permease [Oceanobacillus polygoni]|uniref:ABC-2 type transport system permease protein n=1 Tax=Oceanobacillus polygoni TaxID=1235259 RepID=A0A9X1CGR4_9BACI|nr:ABC transporter permease [Oceanobacillus polygoni]MBP2077382.1 ABC-2 type transport system permease protein [Oceanobacillus polygoni]